MRQEFPLYHTYKNKAINLGTLSVSANLESIRSTVFDRFYEWLFYQAVEIFLISLFVLFIVRSLIGKRLVTMAAYVRELRPDRLDKPLVPLEERRGEKQDELDQVAAAINSALHELNVELNRRKAAEEALVDEKEHLSVTLRSIGDGVISTDISGTVVIMNKVAEELTGWTNEEALGRPLAETFHIVNEKTQQICENPVERVLKTGRVVGLANHTVLVSRNGGERVIADSGSPIRDSEGKVIGVVLVFRDITER
ncbi:MAG: PAS domain-containing protein, partial [Nitrospirae bacterium]|nr:PAS domain-containing protein [Nitrospirota bacterium]